METYSEVASRDGTGLSWRRERAGGSIELGGTRDEEEVDWDRSWVGVSTGAKGRMRYVPPIHYQLDRYWDDRDETQSSLPTVSRRHRCTCAGLYGGNRAEWGVDIGHDESLMYVEFGSIKKWCCWSIFCWFEYEWVVALTGHEWGLQRYCAPPKY